MPEGKFIRRNGTRISETLPSSNSNYVHWVTVNFSQFGGRVRFGGAGLLRLMAKQIRSGVATIGDRPLHHQNPACLSLPVVADRDLPVVQILDSAAEIADWHFEEIIAEREHLDDEAIMASLQSVLLIDGS